MFFSLFDNIIMRVLSKLEKELLIQKFSKQDLRNIRITGSQESQALPSIENSFFDII